MTTSTIDGLDISIEDGVCMVVLNRVKKRNAINRHMYAGIRDILNSTALDDSVRILYITGAGEYFTSGNDLTGYTVGAEIADQDADGDQFVQRFKNFIEAFINYPKLIICGVNGPAIGIGVTILPLTDLVYASDTATFQTPFMKLGLNPEGCSSYTFPKIMGYARANEVLLAGKKLTAQDALSRGLLTAVIPHSEFQGEIEDKLKYLSSLPPLAVKYGKALIHDCERDILLNVNEAECVRLKERRTSEECKNGVMELFTRNSKL